MFRCIIFFVLAFIVGCRPVQTQTREITGTTSERVAGVARIIKSHTVLRTTIVDAHLIERQMGDGQLGPSDYFTYVWIKVLPKDISRWKSILVAQHTAENTYASPPLETDWWIPNDEFAKLKKHDPHPHFDRNGWVTLDEDGNIFAFLFTM